MIHSDNLSAEPRLIAATPASAHEEVLERALRPKHLDEYVGKEKIRGQLEIFIQAAKQRKERSPCKYRNARTCAGWHRPPCHRAYP